MKFILENLVRPTILSLKPYSSARDEFQGNAAIFLDANENPYPSAFNRYPDPYQLKLKQKLSGIKQVPADQIFLGNGSDEPIDLLIRAFCEPGVDNVLIPQPTYGMYTVSSEINNVSIKSVRLTEDFDLDLDSLRNSWDSKTKLIFLCSPNNPSGNLLSAEKVFTLLKEFKGIVVMDEAYIDFTGSKGLVPYLNDFPNLVILHTLSKAWGLAAIRLGMCFGSKEIIAILNKIKPPYNISILSQQVAEDALNHESVKNAHVIEIIEERKKLATALAGINLVKKVYRSDANFLLVQVTNAQKIYKELVNQGIIVRDRSNVILCDNCLRITVGTPVENQKLISALNQL